jgi:hypothetical protein
MHLRLRALLLGFCCVGTCQAQEPAACRDASLPGLDQSADGLRQIAAGCLAEDIAALYYNRAYFKDLQASLASMAKLSGKGMMEGGLSPDAFQTYFFLVELIARDRIPDPLERARHLNRGYDQALEVAEMRLKGYDLSANRLERRFGW